MELDVITLSEVEPVDVHWLWPGRIAFGKLTVLQGDPGVGKSHISLDLAARVTVGRSLPTGEPIAAENVVLLTAEDGLSDTVRPRLEAAGGDAGSLCVLRGIIEEDSHRLPTFPDDCQWLSATVVDVGAKLVIIDPLAAYLSSHVNSWNDQHVRGALAPLSLLAERTGAAVVCVSHLNKATDRAAMYRGGGSIAFVAAARSVLLVSPAPNEPEVRILSAVKSSLASKPPSLKYQIVPRGHSSSVQWLGVSELDAETLLAEQSRAPERRRKAEDAKEYLKEVLADGAKPKAAVLAGAEKAGYKRRTIERAFAELGGEVVKISFGGSGQWQLPASLANTPHLGAIGETAPVEEPVGEVGEDGRLRVGPAPAAAAPGATLELVGPEPPDGEAE